MAERQFQDGDVVVVKSGGEPMTVEGWDANKDRYMCVWFDKKKALKGDFAAAALSKFEPRAPFEIISMG